MYKWGGGRARYNSRSETPLSGVGAVNGLQPGESPNTFILHPVGLNFDASAHKRFSSLGGPAVFSPPPKDKSGGVANTVLNKFNLQSAANVFSTAWKGNANALSEFRPAPATQNYSQTDGGALNKAFVASQTVGAGLSQTDGGVMNRAFVGVTTKKHPSGIIEDEKELLE